MIAEFTGPYSHLALIASKVQFIWISLAQCRSLLLFSCALGKIERKDHSLLKIILKETLYMGWSVFSTILCE